MCVLVVLCFTDDIQKQGEWQKACEIIEPVLIHTTHAQITRVTLSLYRQLALAYGELEMNENAVDAIEKAREIARNVGDLHQADYVLAGLLARMTGKESPAKSPSMCVT